MPPGVSSDRNTSPDPRWAFICCYNAARNDPYKESRHPRYSPLEKWPDARIKDATAVLFVLKAKLPAGVKPARGCELRATQDGGTQQVMIAEHVVDWEKPGGLSHYQVFLREAVQ